METEKKKGKAGDRGKWIKLRAEAAQRKEEALVGMFVGLRDLKSYLATPESVVNVEVVNSKIDAILAEADARLVAPVVAPAPVEVTSEAVAPVVEAPASTTQEAPAVS